MAWVKDEDRALTIWPHKDKPDSLQVGFPLRASTPDELLARIQYVTDYDEVCQSAQRIKLRTPLHMAQNMQPPIAYALVDLLARCPRVAELDLTMCNLHAWPAHTRHALRECSRLATVRAPFALL